VASHKLILKGERALREIIASGRPMTQSITAIKCLNLAQALAAKQTFGPREFGRMTHTLRITIVAILLAASAQVHAEMEWEVAP
jgi:hypothetical protein